MITKAQEAKQLVFQGVTFDVLAVGEESMVTKMRYKNGNYVPFHSHPNEQSGYVISGKYRLKVGEQEDILCYIIRSNSNQWWQSLRAIGANSKITTRPERIRNPTYQSSAGQASADRR